ncbi:MAG: GAF domain-containing protein, partial [Anaerolineales bacterium]
AITSLTDPKQLIQRALENCVLLSNAQRGMVILRAERGQTYFLRAALHFPEDIKPMLNKAWDDGISTLVAESGEPLSIHGEPLKPFVLSKYGQAALILPIKVKNEVLGMFILLRKQAQPFDAHSQSLAEAIVDYTAIALVNLQLIHTVEKRFLQSYQSQQAQKLKSQLLSIEEKLKLAQTALSDLLAEEGPLLTTRQRQGLLDIRTSLLQIQEVLLRVEPP